MNPQSLCRAAAVMAVLLTAACGSSSTGSGGSPDPAGAPNSPSVINASRCMRAHGVPNFPDPDSSGQIPKELPQQLGVSDSVFQAADKACQSLWPYQAPTQAQEEQDLAADLKFARCMRADGLPGFPDPTNEPDGPVFVFTSTDGINPHSPQVLAKAHACQHVLPAGSPLPHASESP